MAVNSRPRAFRCGRLVWIKESWSREERLFDSVGNGDDSPTIGISFDHALFDNDATIGSRLARGDDRAVIKLSLERPQLRK